MTEVHRHIWSDEALWNFEVYLKQKEDSSYDPVRTSRMTGADMTVVRQSKTLAEGTTAACQSKTSATAKGGVRDESDLRGEEEGCRRRERRRSK